MRMKQERDTEVSVTSDAAANDRRLSQASCPAAKATDTGCAHEVFEMQAARTPDAVAAIYAGQQLTYHELDTRANQLGQFLRKSGVGPEVPVAVCLERSLEMAVAILGVLKAGGAYVPLDLTHPPKRLALMLEDSAAPTLVTRSDMLPQLPSSSAATVCLDKDWNIIRKESTESPTSGAAAENLAYLMYTSGTTGCPKAVAMPHRALRNLLDWQRDNSACGAGFRTLQFASFGFDVSFQELFSSWHAGGAVVFISEALRHDPLGLWKFLEREEIHRLFLPPAMLEQLAQAADDSPSGRPPLSEVVTAGEALRITAAIRRLFTSMPGCMLVNQYGPTETHVVTAHELRGEPSQWPELPPIGRPIANARIAILGDRLQPVPEGAAGELFIGGVCLARGYWKRPDLTAERFVPHPPGDGPGALLYRTGDLGRRLADGSIEFLGRSDHQVKIRGYRVETGEVEAALLGHPQVRECAVTAPAGSDQRLVAYFVATASDTPSTRDLRRHLEQSLPNYMVPSAFVPLDALPRMPNGKIDRNALPDPPADGSSFGTDFVAPRNETESKLAAIWAEVLGVDRVGSTDDFFALGGHSLNATRIVARILETFGVELTHRGFFDAPSVAELAAQIDRLRPSTICLMEQPPAPHPPGSKQPLSWGQMEIWFVTQLDPSVPIYNEPFTVYMKGPIEVAAVEKALLELVRRHAILRTGFVMEGGEPTQVVFSDARPTFTVADLETLSRSDRESQAIHRATAMTQRPFDLAKPPLFRAMLVRIEEADYRLYLAFHHIVVDAYAIYHVFVPELWQLYEAFRAGKPSPLVPVTLQYGDYVAWQRQRVEGPASNRWRSYWRKQLHGVAQLDLSTDHPRPATRTFRGAYQRFSLSKQLTEDLNVLSRREGATLYMTLLAAFKTLLWRYTQANDIVVGTVEAGRSRPQFEQLLGYFLNTIVLRTSLVGNPTFLQLLQRVKEVTLSAYAHKDLPFVKLVEELRPARDRSRNPLFQVAFVMEPSMPAHESRWVVSQLDVQNGTAKFDLTVELEEREGGVVGRFEYNRDLFDDATAARMIERLRIVLEGIVADPNRSVAMLPLLTEAERVRLLESKSDPRVEPGPELCLHQLFEAQAQRTPDSVAVCCERQRLTYRQLNERANRVAHALRGLGVGPEVMVPLCAERSLEMVIGILAILKAGGAYVPLDPSYPKERLAVLMEDVKSPVLVVQRHLLSELPSSSARLVCLEDASQAPPAALSRNPRSDTAPENLAYVIYTSGTTGRPKGVMVTHRNVIRLFQQTQRWFQFGAADVWTLFHSYAFDFSVWEIWGALLYGGRLVVVPYWLSRSPEQFYDLLRSEKVTVLNQTPSAFRQLLPVDAAVGANDLSLRWIVLGGEALNLNTLRPWFQRHGDEEPRLVNMYGITEATVHVTYRPLSLADLDRRLGSIIGQRLPDLHIYLLDRQMRLVPFGVSGEIYVAGAGVARGYLNRPELTQDRFLPNPFATDKGARLYKSGDLARYLPDGDLEYLGRIDDQVKIRGFRIEPDEIAATLSLHPAVGEALVMAVTPAKGDMRLVAYFVPKHGSEPQAGELRKYLRGKLPDYMIPAAFVAIEAIPLTANGKVDRSALPDPHLDGTQLRSAFVAPRTPTEETLAGIWRDVLGLERIGVHADFFDLGGDSLSATRVLSRIRAALQVEVPIRSMFEHPTIAETATVAEMAVVVTQNQAKKAGEEETAHMLAELEALSDEEAQQLLADKGGESHGR